MIAIHHQPSTAIKIMAMMMNGGGRWRLWFPTDSHCILKGVPKAQLALLLVPLVPLQIVLPLMISRYTTGPRPMEVYLKAIPYRYGQVEDGSINRTIDYRTIDSISLGVLVFLRQVNVRSGVRRAGVDHAQLPRRRRQIPLLLLSARPGYLCHASGNPSLPCRGVETSFISSHFLSLSLSLSRLLSL